MSGFEEKLSELLNDPGELERFADFARSVMGGAEGVPGIDASVLKQLGGAAGDGGSRNVRLLEAMRPYLSERRRGKMERAMRIARLASIASAAAELGGDGDV